MSSNDIEKRLFELGIVNNDTELELLRKENFKLKKDLEQQIEENRILRNNFNESIKNIIEEVRNTNNIQISQPNYYPYYYPYIQPNQIYYISDLSSFTDYNSISNNTNTLDFNNVNSCNHDNIYSINSVVYDYNKDLNVSCVS